MNIQKYKAKIKNSEKLAVGYIIEIRKYHEKGTYNGSIDYLISVTEVSMPNSEIKGVFFVEKDSIEKFISCPICEEKEVKHEYNYSACSSECYSQL